MSGQGAVPANGGRCSSRSPWLSWRWVVRMHCPAAVIWLAGVESRCACPASKQIPTPVRSASRRNRPILSRESLLGIFSSVKRNPAVVGKRNQDLQTLVDGVQVSEAISVLECPRVYHSQGTGNPFGEFQGSTGLVYRLGPAVRFGCSDGKRCLNSAGPVIETVGQGAGSEEKTPDPAAIRPPRARAGCLDSRSGASGPGFPPVESPGGAGPPACPGPIDPR